MSTHFNQRHDSVEYDGSLAIVFVNRLRCFPWVTIHCNIRVFMLPVRIVFQAAVESVERVD